MSYVKFTWTGSEHVEEGTATYQIDGVELMVLKLPNFSIANGISRALDLTYLSGRENGIKQAKAAMLIGVDKL